MSPDYPDYPEVYNTSGVEVTSAKWYYQLVYDKDSMYGAGMTTVNDPSCSIASGDVCPNQKYTLPTKLWDTAYLQKYFLDKTISQMRVYYCKKQLDIDLTGKTLDIKCWGYLNVLYKKWKFIPMSLPIT